MSTILSFPPQPHPVVLPQARTLSTRPDTPIQVVAWQNFAAITAVDQHTGDEAIIEVSAEQLYELILEMRGVYAQITGGETA